LLRAAKKLLEHTISKAAPRSDNFDCDTKQLKIVFILCNINFDICGDEYNSNYPFPRTEKHWNLRSACGIFLYKTCLCLDEGKIVKPTTAKEHETLQSQNLRENFQFELLIFWAFLLLIG
jgi:hypothetical protein